MGSMIGSGIFLVPADMAKALPGGAGLLMLAWGLVAVLTICGALTYGELAAMMPKAGGQYVYLKEAWGRLTGFLYGWTLFTVIQTGTIAAVAVAFARYLGVFVPAVSNVPFLTLGPIGINVQQVVAIGLIALLTAFNFRDVREGAFVQNLFTAVKVTALLAVVCLGLWFGFSGQTPGTGAANFTTNWPPFSWAEVGTFFTAMTGAAFAADAWNNITFTAGEVRDPQRNLPRALLLGTGVVLALYLLANIAYVAGLGMPSIAAAPQGRVGTELMARLFGPVGAGLMAGLILISTFGCLNGIILAGGRVYYAMAQDGLFFRAAARLNGRGVPANSLAFQGLWAAILVLTGSYSDLLDYVMFAVLLFYLVTVIGLIRLRRLHPEWLRPYRVIGYPVVPLIYCLLATGICTALLVYKTTYAGAGLALVAVGAVVYYLSGLNKANS
jgi:basic amino acid/polyamine antiporter, APA family